MKHHNLGANMKFYSFIWTFLLFFVQVVTSDEIISSNEITSSNLVPGSPEFLEYHAFEFPFLHEGETTMVTKCNSEDMCEIDVILEFWLKRKALASDPMSAYRLYTNIDTIERSYNFSLGGATKTDRVGLFLRPEVHKRIVLVYVDIQIFHAATNILVHQTKVTLIAIHPRDIDIKPRVEVAVDVEVQFNSHVIDFIEIGTSNWDTCTHIAYDLISQGSAITGALLSVSLLSVLSVHIVCFRLVSTHYWLKQCWFLPF